MRCRYSAIPSLWALAFGAALAQDPPANPPAEPKPTEEEKPERNWPKFELGWARWGLDGNEQTFRRFGTPGRNVFIREFSFNTRELSPASRHEFVFRGTPNEDRVLEVSGIFGPRTTFYEFGLAYSNFYEASPFVIDSSRRMDSRFAIRQALWPGFDLVVDGAHGQLDKAYEGPEYAKHQRTNTLNTRVAGEVGPGRLDLSMAERRFYDRANFQPDSHTQTWRGELGYPFGPFDLQGSFAQTRVAQDGRQSSKVKTYALDGGIPLSPDFDLQFGFRGQKFELPEIINAYVRERNTSWGRVIGRFGDIAAQLAYRHVETERVRADHRFVDVPKWDFVEGRLSGKVGPGVRWSLKGTIEGLDGNAVKQTDDPNRLYWDDKSNLQIKLDHGGETWGGYLTFNHRFLQNSPRRIEVRSNQLVLGGTWQLRSNLEAFGEWTRDDAECDFTEEDATLSLDSFFPSSRVATLGINWAIDDRTTLTSSYTHLTTDNDNPLFERDGNVKSRFLTAHLRHTDARGNEFGLLFAPGKYEDRAIRQLGYEARVLMLTARLKF